MENKFVPGILIGAVIGGAISLADKSTRQALVQSVKDAKKMVTALVSLLKSARLKTKFYTGKMLLKKFVVIILN